MYALNYFVIQSIFFAAERELVCSGYEVRRRLFGGFMIDQEKEDTEWMRLALDLAGRGEGHVSPNTMVGAVVVRDGELLGQGWHQYCGGLHAERNALKDCRERGNDPEGATIYVTLEPCCHYGKTPPCTEAILEN